LCFGTDVADTKMTKSAGEHWTCSVLSSLGWGAALTRDGLARTDILAVWTGEPRVVIEVQVKSATHNKNQNWRVGSKAQLPSLSEREWFVMVALPAEPGQAPRSYVVPRDHLAAAAYLVHQDWLTDPAVAPGVRNTSLDQARLHADYLAKYEDRWDLLSTPTPAVPVLLDPNSERWRCRTASACRPATLGMSNCPTGDRSQSNDDLLGDPASTATR
jgi:hypothetical protein